MRALLWIICLWPLTGHARAPGIIVGAELRAGGVDYEAAFWGETLRIVDALDGDRHRTSMVNPLGLTVGLQWTEYFAVEARAQYVSASAGGGFGDLTELDYRISRTLVPIYVLPRLTWDGDSVGLAVGAGPGLMWVQTDERGHLGDGTQRAQSLALLVEVALAFHITPAATVELGWARQQFKLPAANALIQDGGVAVLGTYGLAYTWRFAL